MDAMPMLRAATILGATALIVGAGGCSSAHTVSRHPTRTSTSKTVTVPAAAARSDPAGAYDLLHRAGLRVTLTAPADLNSLDSFGVKISPKAGTRVPRGTTIRLTPSGVLLGSPAVLKSDPHYQTPDFAGQPLKVAAEWANQHNMYWAADLPPIADSDAPSLLDGYKIVSQHPAPGGLISAGILIAHGFRPTPLTLTVTPN